MWYNFIMNEILYDDLDNLIDEIVSREEFQRLIELKRIIDEKYDSLIKVYKELSYKYEEALKYSNYYLGFEDLKSQLSNAKEQLYIKLEVKEYLALERQIQNELDEISNEIAKAMSNKFELKKIIRWGIYGRKNKCSYLF